MKTLNRLFICALVVLTSCAKELPERTKDVSFVLSGIPTGEMSTRSLADDVASVLSSTLPSEDASLTIQSKTKSARVYSTTVTKGATVAFDSYSVTGEWAPSSYYPVLFGKLSSKPSYSVSGSFTVTYEDDTYTLPASWDCSALVIKTSDVADVTMPCVSSGYESVLSHFVSVGDYSVVYVSGSGWSSSKPLRVTVTPVDDVNYEPVVVDFYSSTLVKGHWYYLSPEAVAVTGGVFNLNFPTWAEGE